MLRRLAQDPNSPTWGLGFHAQQAVEKALKAVLTQRGWSIRIRTTWQRSFTCCLQQACQHRKMRRSSPGSRRSVRRFATKLR